MSSGRKLFRATGLKWCRDCVDLYIDSPYGADPMTGYNVSTAISNFNRIMKDPSFRLICLTENETLTAFLLCRVGVVNFHSDTRCIYQEYYVSKAIGFRAARILKEMHDFMTLLGTESGATVAISHCSHLDEGQILCKILEKAGWKRAGHYVYRALPEAAPARTQVVAGCSAKFQLRASPWGQLPDTPGGP